MSYDLANSWRRALYILFIWVGLTIIGNIFGISSQLYNYIIIPLPALASYYTARLGGIWPFLNGLMVALIATIFTSIAFLMVQPFKPDPKLAGFKGFSVLIQISLIYTFVLCLLGSLLGALHAFVRQKRKK